jgi:hypothetical protein
VTFSAERILLNDSQMEGLRTSGDPQRLCHFHILDDQSVYFVDLLDCPSGRELCAVFSCLAKVDNPSISYESVLRLEEVQRALFNLLYLNHARIQRISMKPFIHDPPDLPFH